MIFKEYLKQQMDKVTESEDGKLLTIQTDVDYAFTFHEDCVYEMYDDFCILTDKKTGANIVIKYDKINFVQIVTEEAFRKQLNNLDGEDILKMLLSD